jgi:hypothetical protein
MMPALPLPIARLWCLHWPRRTLEPADLSRLRGHGIVLDTCLRQLAFGLAPRPALLPDDAGEIHTGPAAYQLLLEVASGLQSAVPGETNVFGQFLRAAAAAARDLAPDQWRELQPLVAALQADTRALRASHLQGVAGGSYGSLVRALLQPGRDARVLFIGTGELARSMLPLFSAFAVGVWNHRPAPPLGTVHRWFAPGDSAAAGAWATHAVITTPPDAEHDAAWQSHLGHPGLRGVVHLGQRRGSAPAWPGPATAYELDDVFALAGVRAHHRDRQLAAARVACAALVEARVSSALRRTGSASLAVAQALG